MPELPEVETTRRGLEPHLLGRRIQGAVVREPRLRWPVPEELSDTLAGRAIRGIVRRGKYLLLDCAGGHLLLHLGMSGSLRVLPQGVTPEKHDHVDLLLDNGKLVRLTDPRRFGAVLWLADAPERHPLLQGLGVEPLSPEFTAQWLYRATRGASTAVKLWLMDGRRVCGIGNIYANEALFDAGIHPRTRAGRIGAVRCERLVAAVRETLERAIAAGGSTLRDFVGSDGRPGYFQQQYWVYGRAGEPCRRCGATIRSLRQGQRATYYCPACQR